MYKYIKTSLFFIGFLSLSNLIHPVIAMEEEEKGDYFLKGKYLIKNIYKEYLYADDGSRALALFVDPLVYPGYIKGVSNISKKSIFTFEKRYEGYLIRNEDLNEYLFASDSDVVGYKNNGRFLQTIKGITSNSYFDIIKSGDGFIFKNKKYSDYVYYGREENIARLKNIIYTSSTFTLVPHNDLYF